MPSVVEHVVTAAHHDATLAAVVRHALGDAPWSKARALIASGRVQVNGVVAREDAARVREGQSITLHPTAPKERAGVLPEEDLVYVDRDVVVVRKPAGVLTVPFEEGDRDTLVELVRARLRRLERAQTPPGKKAYDPDLGVVQRLDKDTTGILVFARNVAAKRALSSQLRVHSVRREYVALVHGRATDATHDTVFLRDRGDGLRGSYGHFRRPRGPAPADAQRAITHVRVEEELAGATLVRCRIETGRQHQIRIHLAEAGTPLVGEQVYVRDYEGPRIDAPRPMLHAAMLGFDHPRGEYVEFEDPPPRDFLDLYAALRRTARP